METGDIREDRAALWANRLGWVSAYLAGGAAILYTTPIVQLDTDPMRPIAGLFCLYLLPVPATVLGAVSLTTKFNQPAFVGVVMSFPITFIVTPAILFAGLSGQLTAP